MRNEPLRFQVGLTVGLIIAGLAVGVAHYLSRPLSWGDIEKSGKLIILTQNAATTYYEDRDGRPEGFEYELAKAFARHLGVEAKFVVVDTVSDLLDALDQGRGHIAAAGLMRTRLRAARFGFTPPYLKVRQQLVCNRNHKWPRKVENLPGFSLEVAAGSSYEARLADLHRQMPELTWTSTVYRDTEEILERVAAGKVDCTVANSNIIALNRRYFPELVVPFNLTRARGLAWVLRTKDGRLKRELDKWFRAKKTARLIRRLSERFYGQIEKFDFVDLSRFRRRIETRLPRFKPMFQTMAAWHGLSWTLLAAVAYQESHWDPGAQSYTGVRGLMMLTSVTAEHLGVSDRESPAQSIAGGAKYLADLLKRVPDSVTGHDRLWFALAAYNVGMGHIHDARRLARMLDRNPDSWIDLAKVLPLLSNKKYYLKKGLKHGYARGGEPVRYVKRVRQYMKILDRRFHR